MADIKKLRKAIQDFEFYSSLTSASGNFPATVSDINKVIQNVADVLKVFVSELEKE